MGPVKQTVPYDWALQTRSPRPSLPCFPTCAYWPGIVPARLPIGPQDAAEGGGAFHLIAPVAVVGDGGAQLQVRPHSTAVLDGTRIKTGLPWVFWRNRKQAHQFLCRA